MKKIPVSHEMKIDHNSYYLALTQAARFVSLSGTIVHLVCL